MLNRAARIAGLINKYRQKKLTPSESQELQKWIDEKPENKRQFEELIDDKILSQKTEVFKQINTPVIWEKLQKKIADPQLGL